VNKKTFIAEIIISVFLTSIVGLYSVEVVTANWILPPTEPATTPPTVILLSPVNGSTYRERFVLDFNLSSPQRARGPGKPSGSITGLAYMIDDQPEQSIEVPYPYAARPDEYRRIVPIALSNTLDDGKHTLKIISYCETYYVPENSTFNGDFETYKFSSIIAVVNFNTAVNPQIIFLSPENKTYNTPNMAINFTIDRPTLWVKYSLDNQVNVTIAENTTLTGLHDGVHSLIICANDTAGNIGKSDPFFFTVDTTSPSPNPSNSPTQQPALEPTQTPTTTIDPKKSTDSLPIITGIIVVITLAIAGTLIYFKKRKRN
jgi:hypothetical protein